MPARKQLLPVAILSGLAAVLTLIAAAAGLFVPNFYEPVMPANFLIGAYAQDLIAIGVALILLGTMVLGLRGSVRALPVWAGCLGYLIYAYLLWSFDAVYTVLYPAYLAILSLSLFAVIILLGRIDAGALRRQVMENLPARSTAAMLLLPAVMLVPWLVFVLQGVAAQTPPATNSVLVIDLTFIIPASVLTAVLLWRRQTWGIIFAGVMLLKMTTMGLALAISAVWGGFAGLAVDPMLPLYGAYTLLGGAALVRYLRYVGGDAERKEAVVGRVRVEGR